MSEVIWRSRNRQDADQARALAVAFSRKMSYTEYLRRNRAAYDRKLARETARAFDKAKAEAIRASASTRRGSHRATNHTPSSGDVA